MEFVKKALVQIKEHLGTLNARDKMLFVLIVAMIAGSFFWLVQSNAALEMIPLLDQDMTTSQTASIQNQLDMWGVTYQVQGNRIMVRRQEQEALMARLQMAGALPKDMQENWHKAIASQLDNMWLTAADREKWWQVALEQRLAGVVGMMDDVQDAQVVISQGSRRMLSDGPSSDPSASVYLKMRGGCKPSKQLVRAVAGFVANSVPRLMQDRVTIVADGAAYQTHSDSSPYGGDVLEKRQEYERRFVSKIEHVLGIANVLVEVFVELESNQVHTEEQVYGEPIVAREHTRENINRRGDSEGEPGVRANVSASVVASNAMMERSEETEAETEYKGQVDSTTTVRQTLPDEVKSVRATINVPYSHFMHIYKSINGKDEDPTQQQLQPIIDERLAAVRKAVMQPINADDDSQVHVGWFYDGERFRDTTETALAGGGVNLSGGSISAYAKPAGLAILAIGSLIMVMMMLRKASAGIALPNIDADVLAEETPPVLENENSPVGEAGQSEGILKGIEVDEETVRTRKISEQVGDLVREDPDVAAGLVRQWISQDK